MQVGVAQVFSPGLFLEYGVPHAPVSVGVGAVMAPQLRKNLAAATTDDNKNIDVIRYGVTVAIDIPLL